MQPQSSKALFAVVPDVDGLKREILRSDTTTGEPLPVSREGLVLNKWFRVNTGIKKRGVGQFRFKLPGHKSFKYDNCVMTINAQTTDKSAWYPLACVLVRDPRTSSFYARVEKSVERSDPTGLFSQPIVRSQLNGLNGEVTNTDDVYLTLANISAHRAGRETQVPARSRLNVGDDVSSVFSRDDSHSVADIDDSLYALFKDAVKKAVSRAEAAALAAPQIVKTATAGAAAKAYVGAKEAKADLTNFRRQELAPREQQLQRAREAKVRPSIARTILAGGPLELSARIGDGVAIARAKASRRRDIEEDAMKSTLASDFEVKAIFLTELSEALSNVARSFLTLRFTTGADSGTEQEIAQEFDEAVRKYIIALQCRLAPMSTYTRDTLWTFLARVLKAVECDDFHKHAMSSVLPLVVRNTTGLAPDDGHFRV